MTTADVALVLVCMLGAFVLCLALAVMGWARRQGEMDLILFQLWQRLRANGSLGRQQPVDDPPSAEPCDDPDIRAADWWKPEGWEAERE